MQKADESQALPPAIDQDAYLLSRFSQKDIDEYRPLVYRAGELPEAESFSTAVTRAIRNADDTWTVTDWTKAPLRFLANAYIRLYRVDLRGQPDFAKILTRDSTVISNASKSGCVAVVRRLKEHVVTGRKGCGCKGKSKPRVKAPRRFILGGGWCGGGRRDVVPMAEPDDRELAKESMRWPVPGRPALYCDLRQLQNDRLVLRYRNSNLYRISPTKIGPVAKAIAVDLMLHGRFRADLFKTLDAAEKRLLEQFIHHIGYDNIEGYDGPVGLAELREHFDIYRGQIDAGNGNSKIKGALKDCVTEMVRLKHMTAKQGVAYVERYCQ